VVTEHPDWSGFQFSVVFTPDGMTQGFHIDREPSAPVLTARHMQSVPFGRIEQVARLAITELSRSMFRHPSSAGLVAADVSPAQLRVAATTKSRPPRRDPGRDLWLAQIAECYVRTSGDRTQREVIGKSFNVSPRSVPDLIKEARRIGLLTPTTQGRGGGSLTPRAEQLLEEDFLRPYLASNDAPATKTTKPKSNKKATN
jgi:hypothetical protein